MNWEAIGAVGEVFGGLAVLATLVYLARQVSSAEKMMRAETRNRRLNDSRDLNFFMMQHPEIGEILNRVANTLDDSYDMEEFQMWVSYSSSFFVQLQADFELYQDKIFSEEDLDKFVRSRLRTAVELRPRTVLAWERAKMNYPSDFVKFMDEEIAKAK